MKSKMKRYLSLMLVFSMIMSMTVMGVSAVETETQAPADAIELTFTYPEDIAAEEVTVELYKGFPTSSSSSLEQMITNGQLTEIKADETGAYAIAEPGTYSYPGVVPWFVFT